MIIYYSGGFPYFTPKEIDAFHSMGIKSRLFAYPFIENDRGIREGFEHIKTKYIGDYLIMMDSGAFTVAMKGMKIDLTKYADFLLANKEHITVAVNLDVIVSGEQKTPKALMKAAEEGWSNLKYLESRGLKVLHTFHSGEDESWLKKLMDNYEYFGISRTGDVGGVEQRIEKIFSKLVDKEGKCRWKVHGFGITSPIMMIKYPFFSVDSASWIKFGCYGMAVIFHDGKLKSLGISDRKLTLWSKKGQHFNNLNKEERKLWESEMEKRNISRNELQDNRTRDMWNIKSFLELEEWLSKQDIRFKAKRRLF